MDKFKDFKAPKISVIVPIYNVAIYLPQALDSLCAQTMSELEFICINDASTDKSLNILEEYAQKDKRFKIINNEKNVGPGESRNNGLKIAKGEYIMFLDPDDWLENNACLDAYNKITQSQTDMCFFNFTYHFYDKNNEPRIRTAFRLETFEKVLNQERIKVEEIEGLTIRSASVWTQIYNKNFLNKINAEFSNTRTCEDNPFFFNALCNAQAISVLNKELYNYRLRKTNEKPYYIKHYKDVLKNKQIAYEFVLNSNKKNLIDMYIPYYWSSMAASHLKNLVKQDKRYSPRVFSELHKLAVTLNENHNIKEHKKRIDYKLYKIYLKSNSYLEYKIRYAIHWFVKRIFSTRASRTHIITLLFGFKIKTRLKKHDKQKKQ